MIAIALCALPAQAQFAAFPAPTPVETETWAESITAVADLGSNGYVQLAISISNVGPGSGNGACRAVIVRDGTVWRGEVSFGQSDWSARPAKTLRAGPCTITRTSTNLRFDAKIDGRTLALHMAHGGGANRPPQHRIEVGRAFYETEIVVPAARARFEEGKGSWSGGGYVDRSRSTVLPQKLARSWVRFRALKGEPVHLILRFEPGKKDGSGWLATQSRLDEARALRQARLSHRDTPGPTGTAGQRRWRVTSVSDAGPVRILSGAQLLRYAPLEGDGAVRALVRRAVGNPITWTYRGTMQMPDGKKISGILEVSQTDG